MAVVVRKPPGVVAVDFRQGFELPVSETGTIAFDHEQNIDLEDEINGPDEQRTRDRQFRDVVTYFSRLTFEEGSGFSSSSSEQSRHQNQHQGSKFRSGNSASYYESFFREEKKLGSGASSAVFLVSHIVAAHILGYYAVKKMPAVDPMSLAAVVKEVRALQSIPRHKNVIGYYHAWIEKEVKIADFGPAVPCAFVLQEFASGGSLEDLVLQSGAPLPEQEVWSYFVDLCSGVIHLHRNGVVHRDIKPSNLLLQPRPIRRDQNEDSRSHQFARFERLHLLVGDLGSISSFPGELSSDDACQGMTLEYIAPELLYDDSGTAVATQKTDAWAAGLVLFFTAYGHLPWSTRSAAGRDSREDMTDDAKLNSIRAFVSKMMRQEYAFPIYPPRSGALIQVLSALLQPDPKRRMLLSDLMKVDFIRTIKKTRSAVSSFEMTPRRASLGQDAHAAANAGSREPLVATTASPSASVADGGAMAAPTVSRASTHLFWARAILVALDALCLLFGVVQYASSLRIVASAAELTLHAVLLSISAEFPRRKSSATLMSLGALALFIIFCAGGSVFYLLARIVLTSLAIVAPVAPGLGLFSYSSARSSQPAAPSRTTTHRPQMDLMIPVGHQLEPPVARRNTRKPL